MDLNKKIFIRLGIYVGVLLTLFFIVYQIKHPDPTNLLIFILFIIVGEGLVVLLYFEYKAYFSSYDINQQALDRDFLVKELDRVNKELKTKDDQMVLMSSFAGQGIILINHLKEIIYANDIAMKLLDIIETEHNIYTNRIRHVTIKEQITVTLKTKQNDNQNYKINHKDLNVKTILTEQSKTNFVLVIIEDLTDQVQLQNVKKDFFSYAGHELKTPITILRGYAELIQQEIITSSEAKEVSTKMVELTDFMKGFVDDMLMLSRLETFVDGPIETIYLKQMLLDTLEYFDKAIKDKAIKVETDIEDITFEGDKLDFSKLFNNMIENAIKYNKVYGEIKLSLKRTLNQIVFTIYDTGLGIPFKDQERIFERFYRVNETRKQPGTGLGLAIIKHIVNKYHGHISVESKENVYTKFTIVI
ncbi:MAG: ATP-binding protein [Candidatus Caldatribacteriota bacterium]